MKKSGVFAGVVALALVMPGVPAAADEDGLEAGRSCKPRVSVTLVSDTSVRVDVSSPGFFGADVDETAQPEPLPSASPSESASPNAQAEPSQSPSPTASPSPSAEPSPTPTVETSASPTPEASESAVVSVTDRAAPMVTICPRVAVDVEVINTSTGQVVAEFRKWRPWLVFKGGWSTTVPVAAGQTIEASATYSGSTVTKRITAPGPPSSPQNVIETDVKPDAVTLAWTPPRSDGGKPVTGYEVAWSDQTRTVSGTSVTVPDLLPSTTYTFAVSALNALGKSVAVPVVVTTPAEPTVPSAPRDLTFFTLSSPTQLALTWVAPDDDGGLPIEGYLVTWQEGSTSGEMFVTDTSALVSKLKRGTRYTFEVKARNEVGLSPAISGRKSTILNPVPRPEVPSAVRNVRVTDAAHTELTIAWDPPATDGGSPVRKYFVNWGTGSNVVDETAITIEGLTPATRVTVRISAINDFGSSPASEVTGTTLIKPVPRPTVPTVPQNLAADSLNDFILVSFDAPQSDGGAAILYYEAIDEQGGLVQIDVIPSRSLFVVMGPYGPGVIQDIEIRAVNSMGAGPAARIQGKTNLVPIPAPTVPGVPENLEVVNVESDSVSLVWDAPEDTGGTRIIGYDVSWGTGESLAVPVPSVVIEGLESGRFYPIEIRAVNQIGVGAPAVIEVLTNMAPVPVPERPSVPRDVKVQGVTGSSIAIDWNAPASDGGTPVTGYEVVISGGVGQVVRGTAVLLQGLRPNREYTVSITAINQIGDSDPVTITARTSVVPPGPSPAPAPKPFSPSTSGDNSDGSLDIDANPRTVRQTAPGEWPVNPIARSGKSKPVEKEALFLTNANQMAQLDVTYTSPSIKRVVVSIDPDTDTYVLRAQLKKGKVTGAVVLTVEAPSIKRGGITYEPLQSSERFIVRR